MAKDGDMGVFVYGLSRFIAMGLRMWNFFCFFVESCAFFLITICYETKNRLAFVCCADDESVRVEPKG